MFGGTGVRCSVFGGDRVLNKSGAMIVVPRSNPNTEHRTPRVLVVTIVCLLAVLSAIAFAHPVPKFNFPSKAATLLKDAAKELELYKKSLDDAGKYACCIKPPKGSKVDGCNMCAAKNGSCACGSNLAKGLGTCGECKGAWMNGHGAMNLKGLGIPSAAAIKVLPSEHQMVPGFAVTANDPHLQKYSTLMLAAKKVLFGEKRFNCCVGKGGCDECAMEQYCGCGINLSSSPEKGVCGQCLDGQHAGIGRVPGIDANKVEVMADDMDMAMRGTYGATMSQEGSGTSWIPAASPTFMKELGKYQGFDLNFMGLGTANYADAGGKRGESQFFANTMAMLMAQRGGLSFRGMISLDALTNGKRGYPDLLQTGEGLTDRQHPHDLFMELAATYSTRIRGDLSGFVYAAPIGEPALGPAAFQHRPSAWDNPEAPIGHHWNDGTHISYGVVTGGLNLGDRWKLDGSVFNGREPDDNRYAIDPIRLNSYSGRLSYNPTVQWSLATSYGYLMSPEPMDPTSNVHRVTASAFHHAPLWGGNLDLGAVYGANVHDTGTSSAYDLEGAWARGADVWFGRWERVEETELGGVPAGTYPVSKFTLGYTRNLARSGGFEFGLGGYFAVSSLPTGLNSAYGRNPVSRGIFLRVRPVRM